MPLFAFVLLAVALVDVGSATTSVSPDTAKPVRIILGLYSHHPTATQLLLQHIANSIDPHPPKTQANIICDIPGYGYKTGVDPSRIADGIRHLRGLDGSATLGHRPGGGWCFRYSCSWSSGIYACNDGGSDVEVPWSAMADYAQGVMDQCTWAKGDGKHHWKAVQGQAFDAGGWNVIVGLRDGDKC